MPPCCASSPNARQQGPAGGATRDDPLRTHRRVAARGLQPVVPRRLRLLLPAQRREVPRQKKPGGTGRPPRPPPRPLALGPHPRPVERAPLRHLRRPRARPDHALRRLARPRSRLLRGELLHHPVRARELLLLDAPPLPLPPLRRLLRARSRRASPLEEPN